ncbi:MAG: hypothetical protein AAF558_13480 [Verrucomicrobiota bacterium]
MKVFKNPVRFESRGFSLIEVTLSLGIVSFALISLIGLFVVGIDASQESEFDLDGAHMMETILSSVRSDPTRTTVFPDIVNTQTSAVSISEMDGVYLGESGSLVSDASDAAYRLTYTIDMPASNEATPVKIHARITWPPMALPSIARGSYETVTYVRTQ